ncbi:DNA repair protein RecN [Pectinatus frisingensis]|jgi:DNA repair protein RecN (Recombination protein N)|uniref:DNA repair protein RecN n=1 Tax=Pectinatus frisingensis TaxID=865 RepID=UPI0015F504DA|nr:DNA repair protein RecN [Pectinatus frisingensis]
MLKTLTVWNLALIEHIQVHFDEGLNIFTGETGAGKSLLLGALGLLMGQRSNTDSIRNGGNYLRVEAVYDINSDKIHAFLSDNAIIDESNELIVVRQVNKNGKNIIQINGCQVTLTILKALGELTIDIHGQNENQSLLRPEAQLAIIDCASPNFASCIADYTAKYRQYIAAQKNLEQKLTDSQNYTNRLDMLRWQYNEINTLAVNPDENIHLEEKIKKLSNSEKIADLVKSVCTTLSNDTDISLLTLLSSIQKNLASLEKFDKHFADSKTTIDDIYIQLQEISYDVRDYADNIEYDPDMLNQLLHRSDDIERLCRKYGPTITDVLNYQEKIKAELNEIENHDIIITELRQQLTAATKKLQAAAVQLKQLRQTTAAKLSQAIKAQLLDLGMPNAQFNIQINDLKDYTPNGTETAQIMFCANLGEVTKPLQKVVSGGELSRIALAIKTVTAANDDLGIMVFDEIDSGIGGKTAQMVAERIAKIAIFKQVLCVTHLPQIACMADAHFYIDKYIQNNHTITRIKQLSAGEQLNEIARMASGIDVTPASLDNAMEMINNARLKKNQLKKN